MEIFTIYSNDQNSWVNMDVVAIKEGFSWEAFFFLPLWVLWHRLWWLFIGILGMFFLIKQIDYIFFSFYYSEILIIIFIGFILGLFGNDIRRRDLERRGYSFLDVILDVSPDSALEKFYQSNDLVFSGKDFLEGKKWQ